MRSVSKALDGSVASGINVASVSRWIESLGVECSRPLRIERIGMGNSNLTFLVRDGDGRRWVLRRPPLGRLLASAHDVVREARVLSALEDTDVPVPRVLGVCTDAEVTDAPLVLMEFIDGVVVDRMSVAEALSRPLRRAIGLSLVRTLAKIHAVDLAATGLEDLASHRPYAARQLKRWSGQWAESKTRELPELDALTARLRAAMPDQRELTLVHGDFYLRNVIASAETGELAAVLDWELCTLGDPLADLGSLLAYWPASGERMADDLSASDLEGFPSRTELVREYTEVTGRDPAALGFWHALGLWKLAIIGEGVLRRSVDEPRNRVGTRTPATSGIDALVTAASEIAAGAGI